MKDCNKPQFVGASIARPSAAAEMQFALRTAHIVFAISRPVTLEIIAFALARCFASLRIFTGGRPMAAPTGGKIIDVTVIQRMET